MIKQKIDSAVLGVTFGSLALFCLVFAGSLTLKNFGSNVESWLIQLRGFPMCALSGKKGERKTAKGENGIICAMRKRARRVRRWCVFPAVISKLWVVVMKK